MSDLSLQLQQAASQLPVSTYFEEALFQREMNTLFRQGPRYVGHQLSVPAPPLDVFAQWPIAGRAAL
jgi:choline monooxygenase